MRPKYNTDLYRESELQKGSLFLIKRLHRNQIEVNSSLVD
jgi:hypothetical protein